MDYISQFGGLADGVLVAVGAMILIGAVYELTQARAQGRPSDSSEWWKIAQGAALAIAGAAHIITALLGTLKLG